jgi:hypothetical protein
MAEFTWVKTPPEGVCTTCGSSEAKDGFVNCYGETHVRRQDRSISGTVDLVVCADCLRNAAALVGSMSKKDSEHLIQNVYDRDQENAKLRDEVQAWQDRYKNLVDNLSTKAKETVNG